MAYSPSPTTRSGKELLRIRPCGAFSQRSEGTAARQVLRGEKSQAKGMQSMTHVLRETHAVGGALKVDVLNGSTLRHYSNGILFSMVSAFFRSP